MKRLTACIFFSILLAATSLLVTAQGEKRPTISPSGLHTNIVYSNETLVVLGPSYPCEDCRYPVPVDYNGPCPWCGVSCKVKKTTYRANIEPVSMNQTPCRLTLAETVDDHMVNLERRGQTEIGSNAFMGTWESIVTNSRNAERDSMFIQFQTNGVVDFRREMLCRGKGTVYTDTVQSVQGVFRPITPGECRFTMWRPLEFRLIPYGPKHMDAQQANARVFSPVPGEKR